MDVATRAVLGARRAGQRQDRAGFGARLEQAYVAGVGVLVVGSMLVAGGDGLLQGDGCVGERCVAPAGRLPLAGAVALAGWGALWRWLVAAGPVAASRAEASWLLATPADRTRLLVPAARRAAGASLVAGGLLGWSTVTALDAAGTNPFHVAAWVWTGAMGALATASVATCLQAASRRRDRGPVAPWALAWGLAAACALVALTSHEASGGRVPGAGTAPLPGPLVVALVVVTTGAAVGCGVLARRSLARLALCDLTAAGDVQRDVRDAVVMLDARHVGSVTGWAERRAGTVRSRSGAGTGAWAVLHRQLLLLVRRPAVLPSAVGMLLVPALVGALAGPEVALVVTVLVGTRVASSVAGPLRSVTGSAGLARSLPVPAVAVLLTTTPGLVSLGWAAALSLLLGLPAWAAVAVTASVLAALVRSARPADISRVGALLMTEAGPVPVGLVARLVRGPDVALLSISPLILGVTPPVAVLLPVLLLAMVVHRER